MWVEMVQQLRAGTAFGGTEFGSYHPSQVAHNLL